MATSKKVPQSCSRCRTEVELLATMTTAKVDKQSGITTRAQPRWLCPVCAHQANVDPDLSHVWLAALFAGPRTVTPTKNIRRAGAR